MRTGLTVALACVLAVGLSAQKNLPEVRHSAQAYHLAPLMITANTNRVAVDVVVRRQDGALVPGLSEQDFQVYDDGRVRALTGFLVARAAASEEKRAAEAAAAATVTAAPVRSVALFFDDVNTDKGDLAHARNAAERFVREALEPNDRVAIFTASDEQSLNFTADKRKLRAAIAKLTTHPRHDRRFGTCPHLTPYQAYQIIRVQGGMALQAAIAEKQACDKQNGIENNDGTEAYTGNNGIPGFDNQSFQIMADAQTIWGETRAASHDTLMAIQDVVNFLGRQPGRRMLLLASGGFLTGSLGYVRANIVQAALHDGVVINSLDARGLYTEGPGRGADYVGDVTKLPLPTYFYEESSHMGEQMAQEEALADLAESTGGLFFHNNNDLTVGFDRLGLIPAITYELTFSPGAIAHDGKFHKIKVELMPKSKDIIQARPGYYAPQPASGASLQSAMDAAMRSQASETGLAAAVYPHPQSGGVRIQVHFDTAQLPFKKQQGREQLDLRFIAGLFNAQGQFVVGKQANMELALKEATWKHLQQEGMNVDLSLKSAAGNYRLRVVVATAPSGRVYAGSQAVSVP